MSRKSLDQFSGIFSLSELGVYCLMSCDQLTTPVMGVTETPTKKKGESNSMSSDKGKGHTTKAKDISAD